MSSTQPSEAVVAQPEPEESTSTPRRASVVELVLDNLPAWTVVAAAITLLYLVWATIDVLDIFSPGLPSVVP